MEDPDRSAGVHGTIPGVTTRTAPHSRDDPAPSTGREDATVNAAETLLRDLAGFDAKLRTDQAAAITALVDERRRVLVVQRTGWGKSAVYFIATRLLRARGAGPTLLVSPLLALMRDQIAAAETIGVRAATINSTNREDWDAVTADVAAGRVDLLLISPERLNHPQFRDEVLDRVAATVGLVVVDEAHCVSDWGHDFRPDYRRIATLLDGLPTGVPVLATTATANDRVTLDVAAQLGTDPLTLRGELDRESLHLSVLHLPGLAARLAWLAEWVPTRDGSGIVYTLTVADAERTAEWLTGQGIAAAAYSGKLDPDSRLAVEADLKANRLKAVVATTALAMGYDKPDLAFVVHLGMPPSPIAYYQAVGRAGRGIDHADVVLLPGEVDARIWEYFEQTALPPEDQVRSVLDAVAAAGGPVSTARLEQDANLSRTRLEQTLKILDVDGAVRRVAGGWEATGQAWAYDRDRLDRLSAARRRERDAMRSYAHAQTCLMAFLRAQLDDPDPAPCGRCSVCAGEPGHLTTPGTLRGAAESFLRRQDVPLPPRKRWPTGLPDRRGNIATDRRADEGRALADASGTGWDTPLAVLLDGAPGDTEEALRTVVDGLVAVLARWDWTQRPAWIAPLPSRRHDTVIRTVAERLGTLGRLPVVDVFEDASLGADRPWQEDMANSTHQAGNASGGLTVSGPVPAGPVLLIDDRKRSGWTLTVAADLLRGAGSGPVLPLVLRSE